MRAWLCVCALGCVLLTVCVRAHVVMHVVLVVPSHRRASHASFVTDVPATQLISCRPLRLYLSLWGKKPFRTFERLLSVLDMSLLRILPIACMVKFDFIADFYVIVIAPLLVAGVVVAVGFARAARHPEKRSKVAYVHGSLLLLGTFLVLPATSMKVLGKSNCLSKYGMARGPENK